MAKILIIEDDAVVTTALSKILESNGYQVVIAQDGLQGTTMSHSEKPDLIILDLILPVGDGLTTLRNLKRSVNTKAIPIIVMSATDDDHLKEEVKAVGVEEYIEKPYNPDKLIARIKEILS